MSIQEVQQTQSQLEAMNLAAAAGDEPMLGAQANVQTTIPGHDEEADENAETNPGELLSVPASFG